MIYIILLASLANIILARTITLGYVPIRPFYAPYPIRYPEPAIWPKIPTVPNTQAQVSPNTVFEATSVPKFPLDILGNAVNELNKFVANLPKEIVSIQYKPETDVTVQKEPTELSTSLNTITDAPVGLINQNIETTTMNLDQILNSKDTTIQPVQNTILPVDDKVLVLNKNGMEMENERNLTLVNFPSAIAENSSTEVVMNKDIDDITSTSPATLENPVMLSKSSYELGSLSFAINEINKLVEDISEDTVMSNSTDLSTQNVHPVTEADVNNKRKPTTKNYSSLIDIRNKVTTKTTPIRRSGVEGQSHEPDAIIFPDEWASYESQKPIASIQEPTVIDKFGQVETTTKKVENTPINLGYVPTRPFYAPDPIFYPQPSITSKPNDAITNILYPATTTEKIILVDKFANVETSTNINKVSTTTVDKNTPIVLGYRPTRPFYAPNPIFYPQPSITSKPNDATTNIYTTTQNIILADKFGETTTNINKETTIDKNTPIILGYKPTRPPFAPNPIFYPQPSITSKPNDASTNILYTSITTEKNILADKFGGSATNINKETTTQPTTINKNTPIILGYRPTRPFYAPNPIFYPEPSITSRPNDASTNILYTSITTEKHIFIDEATSKQPTTIDKNTPSILGHRPTRPFYAPNPIYYTQPSITSKTSIASDSESTTTNKINLVDKFGEDGTKIPSVSSNPPPKPIAQLVATPISLEYVPNLPSFIPDPIRYPEPSIPSEIPNRNTNTGTLFLSEEATQKSNDTQVNLEYQPTRPSFAPNPIFYPEPSIPSESMNETLFLSKKSTNVRKLLNTN